MAGVAVVGFDTWLSEKLLCINKDVDIDVFVEYITGILETDTHRDEKAESIEGIIGEILVCVVFTVPPFFPFGINSTITALADQGMGVPGASHWPEIGAGDACTTFTQPSRNIDTHAVHLRFCQMRVCPMTAGHRRLPQDTVSGNIEGISKVRCRSLATNTNEGKTLYYRFD